MVESKIKALQPIILIALIIIVGSAFVITWANALGNSIQTTSITNLTITFPANGKYYNFTGYQAFNDLSIVNATSGAVVNTSNYTLTNYVYINGNPTAQLLVGVSPYNSKSVNITVSNAEPTGYVTDTPTRGIFALIIFAGCLGLMLAVLKYVGLERLKEMIGV